MSLDEYLRNLHSVSGLSDEELAQRVGLNRLSIFKWRHGKASLKGRNAEKVFHALTGRPLVKVLEAGVQADAE